MVLTTISDLHLQSVQAQGMLMASKREQETELRELRQNKDLLGQWEKQIADIIQWVTEEKEARAYLKTVAKKLSDDVETLKTTAGTLGRASSNTCYATPPPRHSVLCSPACNVRVCCFMHTTGVLVTVTMCPCCEPAFILARFSFCSKRKTGWSVVH